MDQDVKDCPPLDLEKLARELWSIGDVNRLRILALLPNTAECEHENNVTALAEKLGLSQPTVSNHLARLRTLGIVRHQKMCRDVYYWINAEVAEQILCDLKRAMRGCEVVPKQEKAR